MTSKVKAKSAISSIESEKAFLSYQISLKEKGSRLLYEAMLVLDIIDSKTSSLLSYISISLAALIFVITVIPTSQLLVDIPFDQKNIFYIFTVLIILLIIAIILCLSCLNIVGAHTIKKNRFYPPSNDSLRKYEDFILKITYKRRKRYLVAHRISMFTAIVLLLTFIYLLISSS